jgi:hypothetical protein
MTKSGAEMIRNAESFPDLYQKSFDQAKALVDQEIEKRIDVPVPKDMAGGYTHERHKLNYKTMQKAGFLYQITEDEKYAMFIRDMLTQYAGMFKSLPIHPTDRSYATGKIFWQCLNDANWLVYTSQAYDCIYDYLSSGERRYIEDELFKPYADFISIENPQFFNRLHNHSTWGNAAVGMIALAMHDEVRLKRALYGIELKKRDLDMKDNDGGYIFEGGKAKAGFLAQLDHSFSPDGYYTEGPYYQRYAMTPFMLFAMALHNTKPELKIFEYRDSILLKAVEALVLQTNSNGEFFPINDAQKGMSIRAFSAISALDITYYLQQDNRLLSIAEMQNMVRIDQTGFLVAKGIEEGKSEKLIKRSVELRDGPQGDQGALGILRASNANEDEICLVLKYTSQGMGHGHYDKLSYLIYDNATEVLQDYGAARWVNIDQKAGGRYLKENKTWAKQSIAHNTMVLDRTSHFGGVYKIANVNHSDPYYFNASDPYLQVVMAREVNAYPGTELKRTLMMWNDPYFIKPVVIDLFTADSDMEHYYELPFHFTEHLMQTSFSYSINTELKPMGEDHGYQHLFEEARGILEADNYQMNWFNEGKFFTITALGNPGDEMILARIGANDPEFNLRRDALMIHAKKGLKDPVYLNVIESHGDYSPVPEVAGNPYSLIKKVNLALHNDDYSIFTIEAKEGKKWTFMLAHQDMGEDTKHKVMAGSGEYNWTGPFKVDNN